MGRAESDWLLRRDLRSPPGVTGFDLDPDFVETIFGSDKIDYLGSQLVKEAHRQKLLAEIPQEADTLVLMNAAFERQVNAALVNSKAAFPWRVCVEAKCMNWSRSMAAASIWEAARPNFALANSQKRAIDPRNE